MTNETVEIKINEHDKKLKEHDCQISSLEKSDIKQDGSIDLLCTKIDKLIGLNNKLFFGLMSGMAGLIVKLYFFH